MKQLLDSIETALSNQNWYVALFSSLALPDICGNIEYPDTLTKKRYVDWFDKYLAKNYIFKVGPEGKKTIFLSGEDCYAFRCSLLHEGSSDITPKKIQQTLTKFHFIFPPSGIKLHCNMRDSVLQLQTDLFCWEFLKGVKNWLEDIKKDMNKKRKLEGMLKIEPLGKNSNLF